MWVVVSASLLAQTNEPAKYSAPIKVA